MKVTIFFAALLAFISGLTLDYFNYGDPYPSEPLFILGGAVVIPCFILLFLNGAVFKYWIRFASWCLPFIILIILITPTSGGAWFSIPPSGREDTTWLLAVLFVTASLVLIVWKSRRA